jgi:hypothetical protein
MKVMTAVLPLVAMLVALGVAAAVVVPVLSAAQVQEATKAATAAQVSRVQLRPQVSVEPVAVVVAEAFTPVQHQTVVVKEQQVVHLRPQEQSTLAAAVAAPPMPVVQLLEEKALSLSDTPTRSLMHRQLQEARRSQKLAATKSMCSTIQEASRSNGLLCRN